MQYCKIFGYPWLEGSIRRDLDSAGRGIWIDILILASLSRRAGYLERSAGIPYDDEELATKFRVPFKLLLRTIATCISEGRLSRLEDGTYYVANWNTYQDIELGSEQDYKASKASKVSRNKQARQAESNEIVNEAIEARAQGKLPDDGRQAR